MVDVAKKRYLIFVTGLLLGHCIVQIHLYRMGLVSNPICSFGEDQNQSAETMILSGVEEVHCGCFKVF